MPTDILPQGTYVTLDRGQLRSAACSKTHPSNELGGLPTRNPWITKPMLSNYTPPLKYYFSNVYLISPCHYQYPLMNILKSTWIFITSCSQHEYLLLFTYALLWTTYATTSTTAKNGRKLKYVNTWGTHNGHEKQQGCNCRHFTHNNINATWQSFHNSSL